MDIGPVCERLGLILVEVLRTGGGGSIFVAHVRNSAGEHFVLKQIPPLFSPTEIPALQSLGDRGIGPRLIRRVEPNLYLAEWLWGQSLANVPSGEPVGGAAIGLVLRELHQIAPPDDLPDVREAFLPGWTAEWTHLPASLLALGEQLCATLAAHPPGHDVFLHGDLVPANVMLTPDGVRFIDPLGRCGLAAWDLAQLAVSAEGRGRFRLLPALLRGYGVDVPLLAEMVAWMVLHYLNKNLAVSDSPFLPPLRRLTESVVEARDPASFLHRYLSSVSPPDLSS